MRDMEDFEAWHTGSCRRDVLWISLPRFGSRALQKVSRTSFVTEQNIVIDYAYVLRLIWHIGLSKANTSKTTLIVT